MISYPEDCLACYPTLLALVIFLTLEQMVLESLYASPSKPWDHQQSILLGTDPRGCL
jgi:hypothetical protein